MDLNTREKQLLQDCHLVAAARHYRQRTGESLAEAGRAIKMYRLRQEMDCAGDAFARVIVSAINRR